MFKEDSIVVRVWAAKVRAGEYTIEQVPNLSNLREMVALALSKEGK